MARERGCRDELERRAESGAEQGMPAEEGQGQQCLRGEQRGRRTRTSMNRKAVELGRGRLKAGGKRGGA